MLAPLRAFGDFRFKWDADTIVKTVGQWIQNPVPGHYKTPPYLTVEPEISSTKIGPRDKFLVIGSDGLWDMMTPMQVIRLVGKRRTFPTLAFDPLKSDDVPTNFQASTCKAKSQSALWRSPTKPRSSSTTSRACCVKGKPP